MSYTASRKIELGKVNDRDETQREKYFPRVDHYPSHTLSLPRQPRSLPQPNPSAPPNKAPSTHNAKWSHESIPRPAVMRPVYFAHGAHPSVRKEITFQNERTAPIRTAPLEGNSSRAVGVDPCREMNATHWRVPRGRSSAVKGTRIDAHPFPVLEKSLTCHRW